MRIKDECWKWVKGYENLYKISNFGRVKSFHKMNERLLITYPNRLGYPVITLAKNKIHKLVTVHRLVAGAFIRNPQQKKLVNHKNGVKADNRVNNLEWCTQSENISHSYRTGLQKPLIGSQASWSKVNEKQVIQMRKKFAKGGYTYKRIGQEYGLKTVAAFQIIKRVNWKHI